MVNKDHAGISWHRTEGSNSNTNKIASDKKKVCDLLLSPLSIHTPRTRKKKVFFRQFVMNDGWDELSFLSNNNSLLEEQEGIDRYTSIEQSPVKRFKPHCNDKENTMMNPLHRPPPRFARGKRQEYQRLDDMSSKASSRGWDSVKGKTTGYNRPSAVRFSDMMMRSPNSIRLANVMVRSPPLLGNKVVERCLTQSGKKVMFQSPIEINRARSLFDNSPSLGSPSGSSMQTSSTAPTKFVYANATSSDDSITLHTYDYDDTVLTLDKDCDDFQGRLCNTINQRTERHCGSMIRMNEERLKNAVASAAVSERRVLDECKRLGEGMNSDYEKIIDLSYEKMPSSVMEFSKKKSFCIVTGGEQNDQEDFNNTNPELQPDDKLDELKEECQKWLEEGLKTGHHSENVEGYVSLERRKSNPGANGVEGDDKPVAGKSVSEEVPKEQVPTFTFFQRGMCAYNTKASELVFSP